MDILRSALVAHPPARLFGVIERAEHYPAFLPWCASATILERSDALVVARLAVRWHGLHLDFVTRNPMQPPHWMTIGLQEGPFRRFEGRWDLTPLADWGCRVDFRLGYELDSALLGALAGPVFDNLANSLVDAFIRRADDVALAEPGETPG